MLALKQIFKKKPETRVSKEQNKFRYYMQSSLVANSEICILRDSECNLTLPSHAIGIPKLISTR